MAIILLHCGAITIPPAMAEGSIGHERHAARMDRRAVVPRAGRTGVFPVVPARATGLLARWSRGRRTAARQPRSTAGRAVGDVPATGRCRPSPPAAHDA